MDYINVVGPGSRFILAGRATWTLEEERQTLAAADGKESVSYLAEISGRISGMINLWRGKFPKTAHVASFGMGCAPDCTGIGLGTALLSQGIDWARSAGVCKLAMGVFASNDRAIALYRKMGFAEEGRLRGQFMLDGELIDEIRMALWF
jgi:RimJ/RimL family protein N-acetyltransferase